MYDAEVAWGTKLRVHGQDALGISSRVFQFGHRLIPNIFGCRPGPSEGETRPISDANEVGGETS